MFDGGLQGILGLGLDYMGAKQEQRWAKQASRVQMDFQERMSNTAYQRAMADMRQAGINPIMVSKLGGASTPTGALAKTPNLGHSGRRTMENLATAQQIRLSKAQVANTNSQIDVNQTVKRLNSAKTVLETLKANEQELKNQKQQLDNSITAKNIINAGKLSQWQIQYTAWNQAGSQFLNAMNNLFRPSDYTPNWNKVLKYADFSPTGLFGLFDKNHPIYQLPENKQKELIRKGLKAQLNNKNLTMKEFKEKATQVWWSVFGHWK